MEETLERSFRASCSFLPKQHLVIIRVSSWTAAGYFHIFQGYFQAGGNFEQPFFKCHRFNVIISKGKHYSNYNQKISNS